MNKRINISQDDILNVFLALLLMVILIGGVAWMRDILLDAQKAGKVRRATLSYCIDLDYTSVLAAFNKDWCVEVVDGGLRGIEVELQ